MSAVPLHRIKAELTRGALNVVCVTAGDERYILAFDEAHKADALRTLGRWATQPDLSFNWFMAAVASQKIRGTA